MASVESVKSFTAHTNLLKMEGKAKILVVGATGYFGSHVAVASVEQGHETYVLIRPQNVAPHSPKYHLTQRFKDLGIHIMLGDLDDKDSLLQAVTKVDIVISAVGTAETMKQINLIQAIQDSGSHVKRFLPSEFGNEYGRIKLLPPFQEVADKKIQIRRALQDAGIPFTVFSSNCFAKYFVYTLLLKPQQNQDEVLIFGNGTAKACFNMEEDSATMAIKVATDDRGINKVIVYRPTDNVMSQEELTKLWENKLSKSLPRKYIPESEVLKLSGVLPGPLENVRMSIAHSIFVKGDQTNFSVKDEEEASKMFPEYSNKSVDEYLNICSSLDPDSIQAPSTAWTKVGRDDFLYGNTGNI